MLKSCINFKGSTDKNVHMFKYDVYCNICANLLIKFDITFHNDLTIIYTKNIGIFTCALKCIFSTKNYIIFTLIMNI